MKTKPSSADLNTSRLKTSQVIEEITKSILAKTPAKTLEEEVIERANVVTKDVYDTFLRMHSLTAVPMKYEDAIHHIYDLYRARYSSWTKDELLLLVSLQQAVLGAESLRDQLC